MSRLTLTMSKVSTKTDEQTLSSRLTYALEKLKMSQSELARRVGIKPQMIQYLCTSNANKSKFAYEIATALEINPDWLIAGKGPMLFSLATENTTQPRLPLLTWHAVIQWLDSSNFIELKETDYVLAGHGLSKHSFALKMNDTSMVPRFEEGTTLIIDPGLKAQHGDFVLALTTHQDRPMLRQLIKRNDIFYLAPTNVAIYKEIEMTIRDKILGILKQTYYEFIRK